MKYDLSFNGKQVEAAAGETLIDAALGGWIVLPHDCRSGQCESCRVTVSGGRVDDQGTAIGRTVLACQARVSGNADIVFDELPVAEKRSGVMTELNVLSPEVVEVVVSLDRPLDYRPGQYLRLKFLGYPAREYSPSCRLDGSLNDRELIFHVRLLKDGRVSGQLGNAIKPGHRCHIQGPFGRAFLRDGEGTLVLIGGGTGWAPIWSLARAARQTQRSRNMVVIVGSRDAENLYMRQALGWLRDDGVRDVFATAEIGARSPDLPGRPSLYLPLLSMEDMVYVAGPAGLVEIVKRKAGLASAQCFADPFLPSTRTASILDRVQRLIGGVRQPSPAMALR